MSDLKTGIRNGEKTLETAKFKFFLVSVVCNRNRGECAMGLSGFTKFVLVILMQFKGAWSRARSVHFNGIANINFLSPKVTWFKCETTYDLKSTWLCSHNRNRPSLFGILYLYRRISRLLIPNFHIFLLGKLELIVSVSFQPMNYSSSSPGNYGVSLLFLSILSIAALKKKSVLKCDPACSPVIFMRGAVKGSSAHVKFLHNRV